MKPVTKKVMDYMQMHGIVDKEVLVELIKDEIDIPSNDILAKRYVASKMNSICSRIRDPLGRREIFANRNKRATSYVNLSLCNDLTTIVELRRKLNLNASGIQSSLEKVKIREEQIRMEFDEKNSSDGEKEQADKESKVSNKGTSQIHNLSKGGGLCLKKRKLS